MYSTFEKGGKFFGFDYDYSEVNTGRSEEEASSWPAQNLRSSEKQSVEGSDDFNEMIHDSRALGVRIFKNKTKITRDNVSNYADNLARAEGSSPAEKQKGFFDFIFG